VQRHLDAVAGKVGGNLLANLRGDGIGLEMVVDAIDDAKDQLPEVPEIVQLRNRLPGGRRAFARGPSPATAGARASRNLQAEKLTPARRRAPPEKGEIVSPPVTHHEVREIAIIIKSVGRIQK
jgi:hypothetical protein